MKIYKIAQASFSLAAVGGSDNNINDKAYLMLIEDWLAKNVTGAYGFSFNIDYIDLYRGRDFLEETKQYDIVALLSIYNPDFDDTMDYSKVNSIFRISPKHTSEEWSSRLASTNAKYIFLIEGAALDSKWIGNIPGYTLRTISDGFLTVYIK